MKMTFKRGNNVLPLLFFLSLLASAFFFCRWCLSIWNASEEEDTFNAVRAEIIETEDTPTHEQVNASEVLTNDSQPTEEESSPITVDFDALSKINGDVIGWLYCEGTKINYPILRSSNDVFYLSRDIHGNSSVAGCIFASCANFPDFSDTHTILYGHRMTNGTMFGSLGLWCEQEFFDQHNFFLYAEDGLVYRLIPISIFETPFNSALYTLDFAPGECEEWVRWLLSESAVYSTYRYSEGDRFLSMSTCSRHQNESRLVLTCVLKELSSD